MNFVAQLINWRFVRDKIPQTRLFNIFDPNFYIDYGDMIVFSISVTASKWRPKNHFIGLSRRERRFSESKQQNLRTSMGYARGARGCPGVPECD